MRTLSRAPGLLTLAWLALLLGLALVPVWGLAGAPARAQEIVETGVPYYAVPDRSSIYNQNSVALPSMTTPYGQDEVRSASGVACRSSVASSGPYMDMGVIGSEDVYDRDGTAVYGRVVIPLGRQPRRVDCTSLYELEIERLRMELELMRMGLAVGNAYAQAGGEE